MTKRIWLLTLLIAVLIVASPLGGVIPPHM